MKNSSKRPRTSGSFSPRHTPAIASSSPDPLIDPIVDIAEESGLAPSYLNTSTPTPITNLSYQLDREVVHSDDESVEEDDEDLNRQENRMDVDDVEIDALETAQPTQQSDWRLKEPTAHPDYIARHLSRKLQSYYKLNSTPAIRGHPHPSLNFISLFGLQELTNSVRRTDEAGVKIEKNKLRQSYEGKVKDLRIAGKNRKVEADGEWTAGVLAIGEDHWMNLHVLGKDIKRPLNPKVLQLACQVLPGKLPEADVAKWTELLGLNDTKSASSTPTVTKLLLPLKESMSAVPSPRPKPNATFRSATSTPSTLARPSRLTAKRSYQDASFTGYGEAFGGDEDTKNRDVGTKRRKKEQQDFSRNPHQPSHIGLGAIAAAVSRS